MSKRNHGNLISSIQYNSRYGYITTYPIQPHYTPSRYLWQHPQLRACETWLPEGIICVHHPCLRSLESSLSLRLQRLWLLNSSCGEVADSLAERGERTLILNLATTPLHSLMKENAKRHTCPASHASAGCAITRQELNSLKKLCVKERIKQISQ